MATDFLNDSGKPWEHDPGPSPSSRIARIFAETPNYRGIGKARRRRGVPLALRPDVLPGPLTDEDGEGPHHRPGRRAGRVARPPARSPAAPARACSTSCATSASPGRTCSSTRSCTRSSASTTTGCGHSRRTPTRRSSSIATRSSTTPSRARPRLVIAVGTAAKESVAHLGPVPGRHEPGRRSDVSQPRRRRADRPAQRSSACSTPAAPARAAPSRRSSPTSRGRWPIEEWAADDPGWLPVDPGGVAQRRRPPTRTERADPVPRLPLRQSWRLGSGGTSSNRKDNQRAHPAVLGRRQLHDERAVSPPTPAVRSEGYDEEPGDLPYEPPKHDFGEFDRGPGERWRICCRAATPASHGPTSPPWA